MFGYNPGQVLAVSVGILAALATASQQLTTLFGAGGATMITAACTLLVLILSVPLTMLFSQTQQVKSVMAMPGIEGVSVNRQATPALAALAIDPTQDKIAPVAGDSQAVQSTAKQA